MLDRAVNEVAELFDADIAVVLTPAGDSPAGLLLAAQWGLAARHLPPGPVGRPDAVLRLTPAKPVAAAPADGAEVPGWLAVAQPCHLAWGMLTVRGEHSDICCWHAGRTGPSTPPTSRS